MMSVYKVANYNLKIEDNLLLGYCWEKYQVYKTQAPPLFSAYASFNAPVFYGTAFVQLDGINFQLLINHLSIFAVNKEWTEGRLIISEKGEEADNFLLDMFCTHVTKKKGIIFHSSLIEHKGCGLMFLGPSGIGKTTQAELWNKYRDALIINGDIVFVQETEENFLGWGTPWHGSSPYCENTSVPVHAMIVLKQAPENSIRELTGFEKVTAVSNNVFYPQWLENGMELCLETLDHLLSAIPVYELSCRPDEEAVRLTEETLFGN